ncbi:MAG: hypothetical protein ABUL44_03875, partial [Flavobacterium sp.]
MKNSKFYNQLCYSAIAGNLFFVLWILRNGIHEGFNGTAIEKLSYLALVVLLLLNGIIIYRSLQKPD